jgi:transposase
MYINELYEKLLGLDTIWVVNKVELDLEAARVDIWINHISKTKFNCPECKNILSVNDHSSERIWRHLDLFQYKCYLHCSIPRVNCPVHKVKQVNIPWAEPMTRFTSLFEVAAINILNNTTVVKASDTQNILG